MKKILFALASFFSFGIINTFACGELTSLSIPDASITSISKYELLASIKNDTASIEVTSDYPFVEGFGPRTVSTNEPAKIKVDGTSCGFGIYTYTIKFRTISNVIAENDSLLEETQTEELDPTVENKEDNNITPIYSVALQDIKIIGYDIPFEPNSYTYDLEVENDVTFLTIVPTPLSEEDSFTISASSMNLNEGLNKIEVIVTNVTGERGIYTFNVTRKEKLSDNNYLASITIKNHQINFDPSVTSYTVEIGKESSLDIEYETESKSANCRILGNAALEDGSVITMIVVAEDGSTREYDITVKRKFNLADNWMYIAVPALILLLIVLLIINKKQKNKKKMGPNEIASQTETAGVIKAPTATMPSATPEVISTKEKETITPSTSLQIIEPTNIDTLAESTQPKETTQGLSNTTEIFKL